MRKSVLMMIASVMMAAAFLLTGCDGGSGDLGGSDKPQSSSQTAQQKPDLSAFEKLVEKEGNEVSAGSIKVKTLTLESDIQGLASPGYMPEMAFWDDSIYAVTKAGMLQKLTLKDKKLVVEKDALASDVEYVLGTDGRRVYFRCKKDRMPHALLDDKDVGAVYPKPAYLTPSPDLKTAFTWSNSGAIQKVEATSDGKFAEPPKDVKFMPTDNPYITAGWFSIVGDRMIVQGRAKNDTNKDDIFVREHDFSGELITTYGPSKDLSHGSYYLTEKYMLHARANSKGLDFYDRKSGNQVGNLTTKQLDINSTYGCQIGANTIALLDHWGSKPKLVLIQVEQ